MRCTCLGRTKQHERGNEPEYRDRQPPQALHGSTSGERQRRQRLASPTGVHDEPIHRSRRLKPVAALWARSRCCRRTASQRTDHHRRQCSAGPASRSSRSTRAVEEQMAQALAVRQRKSDRHRGSRPRKERRGRARQLTDLADSTASRRRLAPGSVVMPCWKQSCATDRLPRARAERPSNPGAPARSRQAGLRRDRIAVRGGGAAASPRRRRRRASSATITRLSGTRRCHDGNRGAPNHRSSPPRSETRARRPPTTRRRTGRRHLRPRRTTPRHSAVPARWRAGARWRRGRSRPRARGSGESI